MIDWYAWAYAQDSIKGVCIGLTLDDVLLKVELSWKDQKMSWDVFCSDKNTFFKCDILFLHVMRVQFLLATSAQFR